MIGVSSCDSEFRNSTGADAGLLHDSGDGVFSAPDAHLEQFAMHARTAVGVELWALSNGFDRAEDDMPLGLSRLGRLLLGGQPLVERRAANEEHFALGFDGPNVSMLTDELKPQEFSLAKRPWLFLKYRVPF